MSGQSTTDIVSKLWNLCNVLKDASALQKMTSLDLSDCGLNNFALATLAPALGRSVGTHGLQALEELNLSNNDALTGKVLDRKLIGSSDLGSLKAANVPWIYGHELKGWDDMLVALSFSKVKTLAVENCHLGDAAFKGKRVEIPGECPANVDFTSPVWTS